jgi:hypothetical protein
MGITGTSTCGSHGGQGGVNLEPSFVHLFGTIRCILKCTENRLIVNDFAN